MKHTEMVELMGKVVTVKKELVRLEQPKVKWYKKELEKYWSGWIVGFTYKQDGKVERGVWDDPSRFIESSRQLCILVKSWPTKKAIPIPLDGYSIGGLPQPPDYGGWQATKRMYRK